MNIARFSIKHTSLTISIMLILIAVGLTSFKAMTVGLFPETNVPVVSIVTAYPGAAAAEIETLVSKPLEDQISTISGLKHVTSTSLEGVSTIVAEFKQEYDVHKVEQEVKDKVDIARNNLPSDVEDPLVRRYDPTDLPIMTLSVSGELPATQLYELADRLIKIRIEQVNNVGAVDIVGGRKREIEVLLDRDKLARKDVSVTQVSSQIEASGENIPSGKIAVGGNELIFRGLGEFASLRQISDVVVNFFGNEFSTNVGSLGVVKDGMEQEKNRAYILGQKALFMDVYKQSGANTIEVADGVNKVVTLINQELAEQHSPAQLRVVIDSSKIIKANVDDVYETITIAILLTVITVLFFLGSLRNTIITAMSLPVSLIGAFIAMKMGDFSLNIISLLALSLAVGLLVDDAIVVIENIHRRIHQGQSARQAAEEGTREIQMSVIAITLVVVSVFVPVAFMGGLVGEFLKQFGLTIAFAMIVSLFVSLTLIPMLSAYFLHNETEQKRPNFIWDKSMGVLLRGFDRFQGLLEKGYEHLLHGVLKRPFVAIIAVIAVFMLSLVALQGVPKNFKPANDSGEVVLNMEMDPGESLDGTELVADKVAKVVAHDPRVALYTLTIGGKNGESNKAEFFIKLKKGEARGGTTSHFIASLRDDLKAYADYNLVIKERDPSGGMAGQPIMLHLRSTDSQALADYSKKVVAFMRQDQRIKDVQSNLRTGKPEFRIIFDPRAANIYGVTSRSMGMELRGQVEGFTPAKFRVNGEEYNIRVHLQPDQRDLAKDFDKVLVPNVNHKLIHLSDIAKGEQVLGDSEINRLDRSRYVQITAGLAPGVGLGDVVKSINGFLDSGASKVPADISYSWAGDVERMNDMNMSSVLALGFAVFLIYLILASLYDSFVTPITILVALPLALSGAFYALYIANEALNIFAILGIFLLIGIAGKNSILLVDYANQRIAAGMERSEAILQAGLVRLRPILMTSFALIAGTIPVAIGLNEASKTRTAMGWAIIGGIVTSTLLTLIIVPAIFSYVDRYRVWSRLKLAQFFFRSGEVKQD